MIKNILFIVFQYLMPQHAISRLAGWFANCKWGFIKDTFITCFINHFKVDLSEALQPDATRYENFNAFFVRSLKPEARPICTNPNSIACPADGAISEIGFIENDQLLQAKGHHYSLLELVGGNPLHADLFKNGIFATVYLSPKDYHRVHMPLTGTLQEMIFIPGKLFSVNAVTANNVPNLFSRNERVVCIFNTEFGVMAVILVGAMIVASIETVWAGIVAPQQHNIQTTHYNAENLPKITLQKGDELGRFLLGSTAIVLLPKEIARWAEHLESGSNVKMGSEIGSLIKI